MPVEAPNQYHRLNARSSSPKVSTTSAKGTSYLSLHANFASERSSAGNWKPAGMQKGAGQAKLHNGRQHPRARGNMGVG